ncbi:hypothetical protein HDU87_000661 [Geranomyces variabilis]|uniref:Thioredoxin domain-containing protein n=1 Tax=Geranomyces variabilis TaxID=109894 RepID=A0AAD5TBV3_9FUNG|nr:hypothetical protein HDU87_000661 [Geranomyces variabilis]
MSSSRSTTRPLLLLLVLVVALLAVPSVSALYSSRDPVVQITSKNFKSEVLDTEHAVIAEFFAPWCGHCKNLAPEYKKAAEKLKGLAKVVAVDCDNDQNKPICGQYDVKGFPTIKVFRGGVKGLPQDYNGPRTAKGLVEAAVAAITGNVAQIGGSGKRAVQYEDFLEKTELPRAILVSQKSSTPPLLKALSVEYRDRVHFGELRASEKETISKLNVSAFPAVILFPKDSKDPVVYDGKLKHAGLTEFLDKHAGSKLKTPPKTESKADKKKAEKAKKDSKADKMKAEKKEEPVKASAPEVIEAKAQADLSACLDKGGFCVVSFLALEPEFEESTKAHQENIKLLESVAQNQPGFRYIWINAVQVPAAQKIMREFQMSDTLPGLVSIHGSKKAYRVHTGPFDADGVTSFLKDVSNGRGRFFRYDTMTELTVAAKEEPATEKRDNEEL